MNFRVIIRSLGWMLLFEAIFFLIPLVTAAIYWEQEFFSFLISIAICAAVGGLCLIGKPKNLSVHAKEGFIIVATSWIIMSLFGALPFYISRAIPSYVDALFETVSGFTTTGATIMPNGQAVESMAKSLLIWRSFTHWVGGMGVLVFIMAFLPMSGAGNMHIMKAESPGPSVSKLVPKIKQTAIILYAIYSVLSIVQLIMLLCGGMPLFDAVNTMFATAGTGGFVTTADGMTGYKNSVYIQIVVIVFMLLFSINFTSYYLMLKGRFKEAINTEVRVFLTIVVVAITAIALNLVFTSTNDYSIAEAIRHSAFSVSSVISTTGFTTENFDLWPAFSKTILVILMFVGACAGSTGGGIKVSRFILLFKGSMNEVRKLNHPNQIKQVTIDKRAVDNDILRTTFAYLFAYILIFVISLLLISIEGFDLVTSFTSVATTLNNVGPGLGMVGPVGSFASYSAGSKLVFIFDMLAGRLEIFPMLILFAPSTWRK